MKQPTPADLPPPVEAEAITVDTATRRRGLRARVVAHPRLNELSVSVGAIVGVTARWLLSLLSQQHVPATFPRGTLLINLAGCFGIGVLQTLFLERRAISRELQLCLVVGLLGGFTTFSTFSVETVQLLRAGQAGHALAYQLVSVGGGLLLVVLGRVLAHRLYRGTAPWRSDGR